MTRVSVAVAVRDAELYVAEALDSVVAQLGPDDELIVVDDGSTDRTAAILARYADRAELLSPGPIGLSAARNLGVERCRGHYIGFIDADDRWAPGALGSLYNALETTTEADVVMGATDEFLDDAIDDAAAAGLRPPQRGVQGFFLGAMLMRREVPTAIPFDPQQPMAITTDWLGRARDAGVRFHDVAEVTLERRIRRGSMTTDAPAYQQALLTSLRANVNRRRAT